jgi:hypothetical protein
MLVAAALLCCAATSARAIEGSAAAGPIGGTDIRSAQLPPPGLYGGIVLFSATAFDFVDGSGNTIPGFDEARLHRNFTGPFLLYVPSLQVLGGSIGLAGIAPNGIECGRLFAVTPSRCVAGLSDPYVEIAWSRGFGTWRPSRYPGALPIHEGLTVALGSGAVIPIGRYNPVEARTQGLAIGSNIWDFAPSLAVTYTTRPILAEGTEVSAKVYWNNYLINPDTQYATGALVNVDFAVSERIGRFQIGVAGLYFRQVADDRSAGVRVPPDGRRAEVLNIGAVLGYDMPEHGMVAKVKVLTSGFAENAVRPFGVALTFAKKLY